MNLFVRVRFLTLPSVGGSKRPSRGVRQQASRLRAPWTRKKRRVAKSAQNLLTKHDECAILLLPQGNEQIAPGERKAVRCLGKTLTTEEWKAEQQGVTLALLVSMRSGRHKQHGLVN